MVKVQSGRRHAARHINIIEDVIASGAVLAFLPEKKVFFATCWF